MEDRIMAEETKLDGAAASDEGSSAEADKLRKALADAQAKLESQALKYQVSLSRNGYSSHTRADDALSSSVRL